MHPQHDMSKSEELFARAELVIPGGVNSPVRAFRSVGLTPFFVESARGSRINDVDGNSYLDYVQSWGASILGHADPRVIAAISEAAERGTTYGAPTEHEVELAEVIASSVRGVAMVRLVSSGTEAVMTAIRIARGATGRDRVVKFAGCYHGHSDAVLAGGGSGVATLGLPDSLGVTKNAVADTLVVDYNTIPDINSDVACVIVEPVAANMGLVPPDPGYLEGLRSACDQAGALLIFDEVISGFRISRGGASEHFGVDADLYTFGKVIGGGLPLAAVGGSQDLMRELAPTGPIYQAGTLSGNPLATAAGLKVLSLLDPRAFDELSARVERLVGGLVEAISASGLEVQVPRLRTLFSIFFTDAPVRNFADAKRAADSGVYARFFRSMLARNISLAPSAYEVGFVSLAHTDEDIEATIEAAGESAIEVLESL